MNSHAERHDREKLVRWHRDLSFAASPGAPPKPGERFPVYAVFLVSAEDRAAHDIFHEFRNSFEGRAVGFEHLVIFGQHGVSSTVLGLLSQFQLPRETTPTLVLFADPAVTTVSTLSLPAGIDADNGLWRQVLAQIEAAADQGPGFLKLASLPGFTMRPLGGGRLLQHVSSLLDHL